MTVVFSLINEIDDKRSSVNETIELNLRKGLECLHYKQKESSAADGIIPISDEKYIELL